jgi:hypothetical protein
MDNKVFLTVHRFSYVSSYYISLAKRNKTAADFLSFFSFKCKSSQFLFEFLAVWVTGCLYPRPNRFCLIGSNKFVSVPAEIITFGLFKKHKGSGFSGNILSL